MLSLSCVFIQIIVATLGASYQALPSKYQTLVLGFNDTKGSIIPFDKAEKADEFVKGSREDSAAEKCHQTFDAATSWRDDLFFIKDTRYWRVHDHQVYDGIEMSAFWQNFPNISRVDAAFPQPNSGSIVFISGASYWTYTGPYAAEPPPRPTTDFGVLQNETIRAAYYWEGNTRIYLIGTNQYWSINLDLKPVPGYPKDLNTIGGLPRQLDAAFSEGEEVYFLEGQKAWRLNLDKLEVDADDVINVASRWLGCPKIETSTTHSSVIENTTSSCRGLVGSAIDAIISLIFCAILVFSTYV